MVFARIRAVVVEESIRDPVREAGKLQREQQREQLDQRGDNRLHA
jgi:hypothetical protein